jgi:Flp pilus assembly protein TadG
MTPRPSDAGSVSTELVIITPVAIALLCLIAFVGRTATAREQVDEAARDAARSASLQRDIPSARDAAATAAATALRDGGFTCRSTTTGIDTTAFKPGGQVTVTVRCDIALNDLGLLGLPGTRTVEADAVSVIDQYRATS